MLHNETRELLVEGYERTHDAERIAGDYGISKWTVYHLSEQKRSRGSVLLKTSQRGRKPLISEEQKAKIRTCIEEKPDITINELREKLALQTSYPTVARIVHNMGYTMKKKTMHASEQERSRCAGTTCRVARKEVGAKTAPTRIS